MAVKPVFISVGCHGLRSGRYVFRAVGWGLDDAGVYGSLWSRDIPTPDVPAGASSRVVLLALADGILQALGHADGAHAAPRAANGPPADGYTVDVS